MLVYQRVTGITVGFIELVNELMDVNGVYNQQTSGENGDINTLSNHFMGIWWGYSGDIINQYAGYNLYNGRTSLVDQHVELLGMVRGNFVPGFAEDVSAFNGFQWEIHYMRVLEGIPFGKLTVCYWTLPIYIRLWFTHKKLRCSIVFCMFTRGYILFLLRVHPSPSAIETLWFQSFFRHARVARAVWSSVFV